MATTATICQAIQARLKAQFPQLAVEYFPDEPEKYRLNHPKGALLISYIGAQYGPPKSAGAMVQEAMPVFAVTVTMRKLNGNDGAIDALDALRPKLQGFKVPGCKPFRLMADRFLGETSGLWQYALDFATETMMVPGDDDADPGTITLINSEEQ
jgi:hypothetical protein